MKKLNKKTLAYYYYKLVKQSGEPEYLARGVAIGLAVGFFIPFGLQLAVAIPLSFLFKAAKIPAIAFTFVTNQLTIFFIYPIQCFVGGYLIANPFEYAEIREMFVEVLKKQSFEELFALGGQIVTAFFAGGALFALMSAIPGYFIALWMVKRHRLHKEEKRQQKLLILNSR
ncbi:MAG: DUF2062 domain-containing protein [Victivallaceae bacterium]